MSSPDSTANTGLDALAARLRAFFADSGARAIIVDCEESCRSQALRVMRDFEHHAGNRSPFVSIDLDWTLGASAWNAAPAALIRDHNRVQAAGAPLSRLEDPTPRTDGLAAFTRTLVSAVHSVRHPAAGLVLCMAVDGSPPDADRAGFSALLHDSKAPGLRLLVLLSPAEATHRAPRHRPEVWTHTVRAEPRTTAAAATRPPRTESVWPEHAAPPPLPTRRAGQRSDTAQSFDPLAETLRAASHELEHGRGPQAVRLYRAAADLCTERGDARRELEVRSTLGAALLQLDQGRAAAVEFDAIASDAAHMGLHQRALRAVLQRGTAQEASRQLGDAMATYHAVIVEATSQGWTALALEAHERAGSLAFEGRHVRDGVRLWSQGVALALETPQASRLSVARRLARRLLEELQSRGMVEDVDRLRTVAATLLD